MSGHMGHERVTVLNLQVVKVDPERNLLLIRGAVPGPRGGLIMARSSLRGRTPQGGGA
jgi:large subunit ribosomal protein L3